MHAPKDPFFIPPHQCDWAESTSPDSSGFSGAENIVDLSWLDPECATEQADLSERYAHAATDAFSYSDSDERTQVELDLGGAVDAILARVQLEKRARPSHRPIPGQARRPAFDRRLRLDESRLAMIEEIPFQARARGALRERTQCADLLVIEEWCLEDSSELDFEIDVSGIDLAPAELAIVLGSPLTAPQTEYAEALELDELEELDPRFVIEL